MEQSNERKNPYELFDGFKSFISTFLGIIVTLIGVALVFLISSLEGSKEIKASNKENAIIMNIWREKTNGEWPENKIEIVEYKNKTYYFVVESYFEDGGIKDWYFAYDGGLEYIFSDYKFYILTLFTIIVSIFVSQINYTTSINGTMRTTSFVKTLIAYQKSKNNISNKTQFLPRFCSFKNRQLYDISKQEIVENANINYNYYISDDFDYDKLEEWQKAQLKSIKKIKIERLTQSDLLQEENKHKGKKSFLPTSPEKHKKSYFYNSLTSKIVSSVLSGFTIAFGVVLGNWVLGITYGFTVLTSFITANIVGSDYANNGLRQRYIAKTDLLDEFSNVVHLFEEEGLFEGNKEEIAQEKEVLKEEVSLEIPLEEKIENIDVEEEIKSTNIVIEEV